MIFKSFLSLTTLLLLVSPIDGVHSWNSKPRRLQKGSTVKGVKGAKPEAVSEVLQEVVPGHEIQVEESFDDMEVETEKGKGMKAKGDAGIKMKVKGGADQSAVQDGEAEGKGKVKGVKDDAAKKAGGKAKDDQQGVADSDSDDAKGAGKAKGVGKEKGKDAQAVADSDDAAPKEGGKGEKQGVGKVDKGKGKGEVQGVGESASEEDEGAVDVVTVVSSKKGVKGGKKRTIRGRI